MTAIHYFHSVSMPAFQEAVIKSISGDKIYIASGVYTNSGTGVNVFGWGGKNISISGGWNDIFSNQNGITIIDGMNQKGGAYIGGSTASLDKLWIRNSSGYSGVYFEYSTITITNSTISNNSSGAIYGAEFSNLSLINSTVSENTLVGGCGSAISIITRGQVLIQNSTITKNLLIDTSPICYEVGGLKVMESIGYTGSLIIQNSIIAKNTNVDCVTSSTHINKNSNGFNILGQNNSDGSVDCLPVGAGDLVGVDPLLARLDSVTGINYLTPGSPALDAGSPLSPGSDASACAQKDQMGRLRPIDGNNDGNARCDIGAYESDVPAPSVISAVEVFSGSPQIVKYLSASINSYGNRSIRVAISRSTVILPPQQRSQWNIQRYRNQYNYSNNRRQWKGNRINFYSKQQRGKLYC